MACGDPGGEECAGTQTGSVAGVMTLSESFFRASCSWGLEDLSGQSFSVDPPVRAFRGFPCLGSFSVVLSVSRREGPPTWVLLCSLAHQSLKGAPWVGSCSVVQCVRHLVGQLLYCSAADAGMSGEIGYGDGSTPYT